MFVWKLEYSLLVSVSSSSEFERAGNAHYLEVSGEMLESAWNVRNNSRFPPWRYWYTTAFLTSLDLEGGHVLMLNPKEGIWNYS